MNKKPIVVFLIVVGIAFAAFILTRKPETPPQNKKPALATHSPVSHPPLTANVPAHYETAPSLSSLAPTLAPEQFSGKAREAYQAVKMIPQTIAQMPCYCHCDRSIGHKSLHSCFEDGHATSCATCIDEALLAFRLQKQGLSPAQIREQVIAQFGD
ncbi:MAG TPA: CYCXC family (seleno)protein [Pyrinomonadaceae bacterium]|nr:CYCXC family (seleno)protein [Pyrinomonadaceae bacterium]